MNLRTKKEKLEDILCANLNKTLYQNHVKTINNNNLRLMRVVSATGAVLGVGLFVSSFEVESVSRVSLLYLMLAVLMLLLTTVARKKSMETGNKGTLLFYIMTFVVYVFGAVLGGVIQTSLNAVMFCVFLVILPQIITDYWWRSILPGIVMEVLFIALANRHATPQIFSVDMLNSLSCLVLGMVISYSRTKARAKEYALRETLRSQRDTDALTHLTTRRAAEERIRQILREDNVPCALYLIDVDNFKSINDTYGHNSGDTVLTHVAECIRATFRTTDLVCRLGGDEFLVFAENLMDADIACHRATALLQMLSDRESLPGTGFHTTLSIGIAQSPRHGTRFEELYRKADAAMYNAKRGGKNNYALFGTENTPKSEA